MPELKSQEGSRSNDFILRILEYIKVNDIKTDPAWGIGYVRESGSFIYPKTDIGEILQRPEDDLGFFEWIQNKIPANLTPETVGNLIDEAKSRFDPEEIYIEVVDPVKDGKNEKVIVKIGGELQEVDNPIKGEAKGFRRRRNAEAHYAFEGEFTELGGTH